MEKLTMIKVLMVHTVDSKASQFMQLNEYLCSDSGRHALFQYADRS